jgi:hypothetical protein
MVPPPIPSNHNAESNRIRSGHAKLEPWNRFGPYLSERQWATVREDYSADGSAWTYLPHDHARSRAYRWGEDGLGGISDDHQRLCFAIALWNEKDPILKERLFGLTGVEGNHAEDVKEEYFYLDATPTSSYLKFLYKYPHAPFPYARLVSENKARTKAELELELIDTGVFDDNRYFDVFVEYAKLDPFDIRVRITLINRSTQPAPIHLIPTLWFRNTWSWDKTTVRPSLWLQGANVHADYNHDGAPEMYLSAQDSPEWLFTENETNPARVFGTPPVTGFFKDAFHDRIIQNAVHAVNPAHKGSKAGAHYKFLLAGQEERVIHLRLSKGIPGPLDIAQSQQVFADRIKEANTFYDGLTFGSSIPEQKQIQRQAWAGMLWSRQYYHMDVNKWLSGDPDQPPPPPGRDQGRNKEWAHMHCGDIISMPDKWEYPWYAAWDLAFHAIALAGVDPVMAKEQLHILMRVWYIHPNGQLPAYEWNFSDVNPPVHAWACWRVYQIDRAVSGRRDLEFLQRTFHKLLLNFTWWVNRKDPEGRNVFQGGFLGLDNIGVFDRSAPLPMGGQIHQADGTSWVAMFCLNMMRIALELSAFMPAYQEMVTKFFQHFLLIAGAMTNIGGRGINLWDETDGFFYDVLSLPDGSTMPMKLRSMVGLAPLFAVEVLDPELMRKVPEFAERLEWFSKTYPQNASLVSRWYENGVGETRLLSLLRGHRMKCLLRRALDETEFLSPYGVRALSRYHKAHPYVFECQNVRHEVHYTPGESDSGLFGGNSNWRGPVWFPVNYLLIESLHKFHSYYGDDFTIECPTGSGRYLTLIEAADELSRRMIRLFLKDADGRRPIHGTSERHQYDPHFKDHILFHEYFHGDSGRGMGAPHQTGWTGLIAALIGGIPQTATLCTVR